MTQPNAPENPSTTPPVDSAQEEIDNPGSFDEQLAGIGEYLKQATLAALAAVAEGRPEQVLDLIDNLLTSYQKIRYFKPLTELIDKVKAEQKEAREKARASWKESHEHWWTVAERELKFMKAAMKNDDEPGLSEEGAFRLLERTFPAAPDEPEEVEESPLTRATDAMVEAVAKYIAALSGGGGGCGGGCFGRIPTLEDDVEINATLGDPPPPGAPPIMPVGRGFQRAHRTPHVQYARAVRVCPTCQGNMKAAVDQFMAMHPGMVQRHGQPQPIPGYGLDDLNTVGIDPNPQASAMAPARGVEDDLTRYGREVGNLSQLAQVAAHYGVPSVPLGGAQILSQMGVHTGARVHSVVETAGLDPKMVQAPPYPPAASRAFPGVFPPVDLLGGHGDVVDQLLVRPHHNEYMRTIADIDRLVRLDILRPTTKDQQVTFEAGPNAPSDLITNILEQADREAAMARKEERLKAPSSTTPETMTAYDNETH